ncbi:GATA zinc finger domain-containing protein 14-like [Octopus sinensis]|uniref:GATA zinc finger domain-containing protein 14-like n=1 Tax=Octopus sinensis TaxID=2607531 RepID=A0A7E6FL06_9MOLL|nr:GATA zinc finger domain-containing protein 14-like [Octopus sinensis]XP_036368396.1 GATA zinc finger domain-containing protein 14-like [Octopus sinensis]
MIRVPLARGEERSRWQILSSSNCCTTFPVFFIIMETAFALGLILLLYSAATITARPNAGARSAEEETNFETMVRFLVKKLNSNEHLLQLLEHRFEKMSGNVKVHALLLQRLKNELKSYRARKQKLSGNLTTKDNTFYSDGTNKRRVLHRARRQAAYSFLSPEILETLAQQERIGVNDTPMVFASDSPPLFPQELLFESAPNVQSTPEENLGETTETVTVSTAPPSTSPTAELRLRLHRKVDSNPADTQSQGQPQPQPQLQEQPQPQQQQPPPQQRQQQQQQPQQQQQQQQQQHRGSDNFVLLQPRATPQPGVPKEADEEYEAGDSYSSAGHSWSKFNKSEKSSGSGQRTEPDEMEHGTKKSSEADEHRKTRFNTHSRLFGKQHGNKRNFKGPQKKDSDYEVSDKEERTFVRSSEYENSETNGLSRKRRFQPMAIRAHDPRVDYTPEMNYPLQPDKGQETEENQPSENGKSGNAGIVWISKDSRNELGTIEPETRSGQQNSQDNLTIFQRIDGSSQDYPGNKESGATNKQETDESKTAQSETGEQAGQEQQGQQEADTTDTKGSNSQNQPGTDDHKTPYLYPGIDEHGIPHAYPGVDEHGIPHLYPGIDEHGIPHLYSGIDGYGIPYGGQVGEEYGTHLLPIEEGNNHKHNVPTGVQNGMIDKNRYEGMYPGDGFLSPPYGAENYLDFPLDGEAGQMNIPEDEEKKDGSDESSDEDTKGAALSHSKYGGVRHMERLRAGDIISSAERPAFNMDLYPAESNTLADNSAQGDKDSEESGEAPTNNGRSYHGDYHDPVNSQLFMFNKEYPDKNLLLHKIQMAANQRNPIYSGIDPDENQSADKQNMNYGRPNYNINQRHESNPGRYLPNLPNSNRQGFNRDFRRRNFDVMNRGIHDTTSNRFGYGTMSDHSGYDKGFDRLNYESRLFGKPFYNTNPKGYYHNQNRGYNNNPFSNYNSQPNYNMGSKRGRHMIQSNSRSNVHSMQRMHNLPFSRYNTKSGYNAEHNYNNNQYYDIGRSNRVESSYTSHTRGTAYPASDEQDEIFGTDAYYNNDSGEVRDERKSNANTNSNNKNNNNYSNNSNKNNNTHYDSAERRNINNFMY